MPVYGPYDTEHVFSGERVCARPPTAEVVYPAAVYVFVDAVGLLT